MPWPITLCYTPTHASNRCRLKSFTSCTFCGRLAAPDFVMKYTEAKAIRWPEVRKFYRPLAILHFPTGGANDAQNVSIDTAHGKYNHHHRCARCISQRMTLFDVRSAHWIACTLAHFDVRTLNSILRSLSWRDAHMEYHHPNWKAINTLQSGLCRYNPLAITYNVWLWHCSFAKHFEFLYTIFL